MKKVTVLSVLILVAVCAVLCVSCFGGETPDDTDNDSGNDIYYLYFAGEEVDIERIPLVGGTVTLPAEPERVGYEFGGWYTDKNFTVTLKEHLQKGISGDVTAYAKWIPLGYTVVFNTSNDDAGLIAVNGGQAVAESVEQYEIGDVIVCAVVSGGEEEYYDFLGWYMDGEKVSSSAEYAYTVTDDEVVTVTAVWKGLPRTALFYSNRSADDGEFVSVSFDYGSDLEYAPAARADFVFAGWYDTRDCSGEAYTSGDGIFEKLKMQSDTVSFYAKWVNTETLFEIRKIAGREEAEVYGYDEAISGTVYIPYSWGGYPVTRIAEGAFADCTKNAIVIPRTVTEIEDGAFTGATSKIYLDNGTSTGLMGAFDEGTDIYVHISSDVSALPEGSYVALYAEADGIFADTDIDDRAEFEALFEYIWLYTVTGKDDEGVTFYFDGCEGLDSDNLSLTVMGDYANGISGWVTDVTLKLALKTNTEPEYRYSLNDNAMSIKFIFTERTDNTVASDKTTGADRQHATVCANIDAFDGAEHSFVIDTLPGYVVYNSEQLVYAVENGYKPYFATKGSTAEECYEEARRILNDIVSADDDDAAKLLAIHDYIADNVIYDTELLNLSEANNAGSLSGYRGFNLEGVFLDKRAVCDGITKAFMLMARIEGIEVIRVSGTHYGTNHAWNKVCLNGVWYAVDVTGDDVQVKFDNSSEIVEVIRHDKFMVSDEYLSKNGYVEDDYGFPEATGEYDYYEKATYKSYRLAVSDSRTLEIIIANLKRNARLNGVYYTVEIRWEGSGEPAAPEMGLSRLQPVDGNIYVYLYKKPGI